MSSSDLSIQQLFSKLRAGHFQSYLLSRGWVETPSSRPGQRRFEADMEDEEGVYEMYLPASTDAGKYQTRLVRNIYKLCGIEDREPADIVNEMITNHAEMESPAVSGTTTRLRIRNSGSTSLRVSAESPSREYTLYANDAIELMCSQSETIEIERSDDALVIRTAPVR